MARTDWYRDRADGLWTTEVDPNATLIMAVTWTGRYTGVTGVVPQAPVIEAAGASLAVTVQSFDDNGMVFKVVGSGGTVAFRVSFSGGQVDDVTLRFRSVTT